MSFNGQTVKGDNVKLYQAGGGKHFNHTFTTWWCVCFIKSKSNSSSRTKKNETKKIIIINWKFLNCIIWRVYTIINWLRYIGDLLNFFLLLHNTRKKTLVLITVYRSSFVMKSNIPLDHIEMTAEHNGIWWCEYQVLAEIRSIQIVHVQCNMSFKNERSLDGTRTHRSTCRTYNS